ncbi:MAG: glycosyl hydrolase family 28-related protein [Pyrinomonadaceae bacterium]
MTKEMSNADAPILAPTSRRNFIIGAGAGVVGAGLAPFSELGAVLASASGQVSSPPGLAVSVRDFGAAGDGVTNDTQAFLNLIAYVNARSGGVRVVIPPGLYVVGLQTSRPGGARFSGTEFAFRNCAQPIAIEGYGAILKHPDGMRFGSFNPTGAPYNPPSLPFYNAAYAASTGAMLSFINCRSVSVKGLELHGNSTNYVIGGMWGDRDRQTRSYGLVFESCGNVLLEQISAHHFGLDGAYVRNADSTETSPYAPFLLLNCTFEYNGRQGLSWVSGNGLTAINCKFNHTGYAVNSGTGRPLVSAPGAGVDLEAEYTNRQVSKVKGGRFINCEFVHTKGVALLSDNPNPGFNDDDVSDMVFENCLFWNFENYTLWTKRPRHTFRDCRIYGSPVNAYTSLTRPGDATKFYNCEFEDKAHPVYGSPFGEYVITYDGLFDGLVFRDCTVTANTRKAAIIRRGGAGTTPGRGFEMEGCTIIVRSAAGPDAVLLQGGFVRRTRFIEAFTARPPVNLYVQTNGQTVVGDGVQVDGPVIKWLPGGVTGLIVKTW